MKYLSFLEIYNRDIELKGNIYSIVPFLLLGILLFIIGLFLKKQNKKIIKAKVIKVVSDDLRNMDNHLVVKKNIVYLEYTLNNQIMVSEIASKKDYLINSYIDVECNNGIVTSIVNDYSKIGNKILVIGILLFIFSLLSIFLQIIRLLDMNNDVLENSVAYFLLGILGLFICKLSFDVLKNMWKIKKGIYKELNAKIVDIKDVGANIYLPIIRYEYNNTLKNKVVAEKIDINLVNIGDKILVYKDIENGDIKTKREIQKMKDRFVILLTTVIVILFVALVAVISFNTK